MVKEIGWKKGDFEIRTTQRDDKRPYIELVKWDETDNGRRYCYVIAYFHYDSDGYASLHFVGDRPFRDISEMDIQEIWKELFLTQMMIED